MNCSCGSPKRDSGKFLMHEAGNLGHHKLGRSDLVTKANKNNKKKRRRNVKGTLIAINKVVKFR
jgi:hypothetical protein